eukprot:15476396-Alexandrium_andersonii.AAC.1
MRRFTASIRNPPCGKRKIPSGVRNWNCAGPGNDHKIGPRSSGGVRSAPRFVQIPNPPTKWVVEGVRGREIEK